MSRKKKGRLAAFIDFRKAYDRVDRSKLYGTAYYIYICTVRSEMDFGPVNFPAVCDSLMECVSIIQKR